MNREPVAIAAAVRAVILAATAFGLEWTAEQIASVMLAVEAVLALLVRQRVTPEPIIRPWDGELTEPWNGWGIERGDDPTG